MEQLSGNCFNVTPLLLDNREPALAIYASGSNINVISLQTGVIINKYELHQQAVTKIALHPHDKDVIVSR